MDFKLSNLQGLEKKETKIEKTIIIGAGPAGLSPIARITPRLVMAISTAHSQAAGRPHRPPGRTHRPGPAHRTG